MSNLIGKVAVVTGASRGAGRGIAHELGLAGATVYVTGRSHEESKHTGDIEGTVKETADLIEADGGTAIPCLCDHTQEDQVRDLFEQIWEKENRIDILVNNVWGGYENYDHSSDKRFWTQPDVPEMWRGMFTSGVLAHYLSSHYAAPFMIEQGHGLIVSTSAGDNSAGDHKKYLGWLLYHTAKTAIDQMNRGMSHELRSHGVSALSVYPGFMATERVLQAFGDASPEFLKEHGPKETPRYVGRAIVALASDTEILDKSGKFLMVGELAQEYGFTDVDGTQPPPFILPEECLF